MIDVLCISTPARLTELNDAAHEGMQGRHKAVFAQHQFVAPHASFVRLVFVVPFMPATHAIEASGPHDLGGDVSVTAMISQEGPMSPTC